VNAVSRLVVVILICVCGYNWWQIRQLQTEIASLKMAHSSQPRAALQAHSAHDNVPARSWLDQANQHMGDARSAMERSDFGIARRDLQLGADAMQNAVREPEDETRAKLNQARQTLAALQSEADSMVRKLHPSRPSGSQ